MLLLKILINPVCKKQQDLKFTFWLNFLFCFKFSI